MMRIQQRVQVSSQALTFAGTEFEDLPTDARQRFGYKTVECEEKKMSLVHICYFIMVTTVRTTRAI